MHSLSLITLDFTLCLIFPSQSFRLEVGSPFSSLDIGVCCVGLSFFGLCDSVFLVCEEEVSLGGWVWIPLGDKSIYFTGEDECDSQISWGGGLSCICVSVIIKIHWTYCLSKPHVPLLKTFSTSLDAEGLLLRTIFLISPLRYHDECLSPTVELCIHPHPYPFITRMELLFPVL